MTQPINAPSNHVLSLPETAARLLGLRAVLFDLDGVITPTAEIHMHAWSKLFSAYLESRGIAEPYTDDDYFAHIDGRPRYDGVRAMLASRGIELPEGSPSDAPELETVCGLGNRKNTVFTAVLEEDGIAAYPGSLAFLDAVVDAGLEVAVVSSSKNAEVVLAAAGLRERFDVVMDGVVAAREGIAGKPAPDTYVEAAYLLGFEPAECVVVEDAHSGVEAGRHGAFGLVLGVDRGIGAQVLLDAGADVVVDDLGELIDPLVDARRTAGPDEPADPRSPATAHTPAAPHELPEDQA
ncbi:HAD family hydrolase [Plantibacter sp. RU18]|uniref:HAD family hydrolase n=1 Tax=Plantibacter sp. RU18 TaxID=3158143 RepID=UPI003D35C43B